MAVFWRKYRQIPRSSGPGSQGGSRPSPSSSPTGFAYGSAVGSGIQLVEAFEGCEYGTPLDPAGCARLFPFLKMVGS